MCGYLHWRFILIQRCFSKTVDLTKHPDFLNELNAVVINLNEFC